MEQSTNKYAYKWREKKCVDCGKTFLAKSSSSVRCEECRAVHRKEHRREYNRAYYWQQREEEIAEREAMEPPPKPKPKPVKRKDDSNICKKIESCFYGGSMGQTPICDYLAKTGEKRPCKAGKCTVYKRR